MKTLKIIALRFVAAPAFAFGLTGFGVCGIVGALLAAGVCMYVAGCVEDAE